MFILRRLVLLFVSFRLSVEYESNLPPIIWSPTNPLFSCTDPVVNVKLADNLVFICATTNLVNGVEAKYMFENMWFLDSDVARYQACNATGLDSTTDLVTRNRFLECPSSGSKKVNFPETKILENDIKYEAGKSYYFIATSYRTHNMLGNNMLGGSCNASLPYTKSNPVVNGYKLRLRIYVCNDTEIASGACSICNVPGDSSCYYRNCVAETCTPWSAQDDADVYTRADNSSCYKFEQRACTRALQDDIPRHEQKQVTVSCPSYQNCSDWSNGSLIWQTDQSQCAIPVTRTCKDFHARVYSEIRYETYACVYENCAKWSNKSVVTTQEGLCQLEQEQSCVYFDGRSSVKTKSLNISCASYVSCEDWSSTLEPWRDEKSGVCLTIWKRNCTDFHKGPRMEQKSEEIQCAVTTVNPATPISAAGAAPDSTEAAYWKRIAIIIGVVLPLVGLVIGFLFHKRCHSCPSASVDVSSVQGYLHSATDKESEFELPVVMRMEKGEMNGVGQDNKGLDNEAYRKSMLAQNGGFVVA